jgi:hypothetical protein
MDVTYGDGLKLEGSCEYSEYEVSDIRQEVILQLGDLE